MTSPGKGGKGGQKYSKKTVTSIVSHCKFYCLIGDRGGREVWKWSFLRWHHFWMAPIGLSFPSSNVWKDCKCWMEHSQLASQPLLWYTDQFVVCRLDCVIWNMTPSHAALKVYLQAAALEQSCSWDRYLELSCDFQHEASRQLRRLPNFGGSPRRASLMYFKSTKKSIWSSKVHKLCFPDITVSCIYP